MVNPSERGQVMTLVKSVPMLTPSWSGFLGFVELVSGRVYELTFEGRGTSHVVVYPWKEARAFQVGQSYVVGIDKALVRESTP